MLTRRVQRFLSYAVVIIATAFVLFATRTALAQGLFGQQPECVTAETIAAEVVTLDGGQVAHDLKGDDVTAFLAIWNTMSPPYNWVADHILIATKPGADTALLVFLVDGCGVSLGTPPLRAVETILDSVLGVAS